MINISCQKKVSDAFKSETYLNDIMELKKNNQITSEEYNTLRNYLSITDSLNKVKGFSYSNILYRIENNARIKREIEERLNEEQRIEQLSKVAFSEWDVSINFRDTKQEIETKVKISCDRKYGAFFKYPGYKEIWLNIGASFFTPCFSYSKGYGDNKERLQFFSVILDRAFASTHQTFYVGGTKKAYEALIKFFEVQYGKTEHYYPDLSSYGVGYGTRFTVAKWRCGRTSISIDIYEASGGYGSYETKYIVQASVSNYDEKLMGSKNE